MAESTDTVAAPHDWDKAVSAAYLRALGHTQQEAATGAGVGERTLARWEGCDWWPEAVAEAVDRWMHDLTAASRHTLLKAVKGGAADKALAVLERTEARLSPAAQKLDLTSGGKPIPSTVAVTLVRPDDDGEG